MLLIATEHLTTVEMPIRPMIAMKNNALSYSHHSVFPEVEVLNGQTVLHSYPRHFHDTFGMAIIHSGTELCWLRGVSPLPLPI